MLRFALPVCIGQLLQQLYNMADAWVIGRFADNAAFAAVSTMGIVTFLIIGFCAGMSVGGSVIISRYFGAGDDENLSRSIHTNYLMAVFVSAAATAAGVLLTPHILEWIGTPAQVMPYASAYLTIYFGGITTVVFYNTGTAVMRALGDSLHPLYYLAACTSINILLDLLLVACPLFRWGVSGAALATVISQGISALLCIHSQLRQTGPQKLDPQKLRLHPPMIKEVIRLGLPSGLQNAALTLGNLTVQKNINSFGTYAMAGFGAYVKIESLVFVPIMAMSQTLPTFISQNLGAGKPERAKAGAVFGTVSCIISAEIFGLLATAFSPFLLQIFIHDPQSLAFGILHSHIVPLFYFLLAFAHCSTGILRGCGKSFLPMLNMFTFWCVGRIAYVTIAVSLRPVFTTISWAYPIAWGASDLTFLWMLWRENRRLQM